MTGSYVLDSDVWVPYMNGVPQVVELLSELDYYLSLIALGELRFGFSKSDRAAENHARLDRVESRAAILGVNTGTARIYGELKAQQDRLGLPVPRNDLWIAAQAQQYGMTVVSYDKHYPFIEGVPVLKPPPLD